MLTRELCIAAAGIFVAVALGSARDAHAQAWTGEKGSLDLSLDYNYSTSSKVLGNKMDFSPDGVTTHQFMIGAEYTIIDKLALDVGVPILMLKYKNPGMFPHPMAKYDDGKFHTTLTDLAAGLRYAIVQDPVAIAPRIGVSVPLADYGTIGNAVAGRHLFAAHLGISIGKVFANTFYGQLSYDFALSAKDDRTAETKKYGQNYSTVSVVLGDKLLDGKLDINLGLNYHKTHGGIDLENAFAPGAPPDLALYHDAILAEDILLVGGGLGYDITDKLSVAFAARIFASGQNTTNASVFGLSLTFAAL
jgi:hypothetical protein